MKNVLKAWMALFLVAIFVVSAVPVAFAEEAVEGDEVMTETTEDTDTADAEEDSDSDESEDNDLKQAWLNRRHKTLEMQNEAKEKALERREAYQEKMAALKERHAKYKEMIEEKQAQWIAKVAKAHPKASKILDRLDNAVEKITDRVEELKESGIEVEDIEEKLDMLKESISSARDNLEAAQEKYKEARELWNNDEKDEARELFKEARKLYNAAMKDIREAMRIYRSIAHDVRQAGGLKWFANHPEFTPGEDLGVFVWNDKHRTYMCVSGDGNAHEYHASVSNDDGFKRVHTYFWDQADNYQVNDNSITFSGKVNPHFDCIGFTSLTKDMTIHVEVDGSNDVNIIYLGEAKDNPSENPFNWERLGDEYQN